MPSERFRVALADGLHQVKSPLQALRTFGKLLQRQLAEDYVDGTRGGGNKRVGSFGSVGPTMEWMSATSDERSPDRGRRQRQALKLAEDMMAQGERVVDLIEPMDNLVQNGGKYKLNGRYLLLPQKGEERTSAALILRPSNVDENDGRMARLPFSSSAASPRERPKSAATMPLFGDFNLEMTFPQDVLGPIVYAAQAISLEQGIDFDAVGFDPDAELPGVSVCPKWLQEAVSNLLDNAIKYAPLGAKDDVSGNNIDDVGRRQRGRSDGAEERDSNKKTGRGRRKYAVPQIKVTLVSNEPPLSPGATLYIEDNGPGIPKAEWDHVFERGYRSKTVQDSVPGNGLGLGISKDIVLRMGGMLDVLEEGPSHLAGTTIRVIVFRDPEIKTVEKIEFGSRHYSEQTKI